MSGKQGCDLARCVTDDVKRYYAQELKTDEDLRTEVCTIATCAKNPPHIVRAIEKIHDVITSKYYGCGGVIPELVTGLTVLDLGCGSGRDAYILSQLVGENGSVIGVDMTDEQLAIANRYVDYHTREFGYCKPNIRFVKAYVERMDEAGIEDSSVDILVSNCVVSVCADKKNVFREVYRVLKDGGEMVFCDMYSDREIPETVRCNTELWGEGFGGSILWKEFLEQAINIGFSRPRLVKARPISVQNPAYKNAVGDIQYASATYRMFKLPRKDGVPSTAIYKGGICGCEDSWQLDHAHLFEKSVPNKVGKDVVSIINHSRFAQNFDIIPKDLSSLDNTKDNNLKITEELADPFDFIRHYRSCLKEIII